MNDNMEAGADIHAGDGGYSESTQEKYDAFVKNRNRMNERIRNLVGHSKADIIEPEHAKISEVPEVTFKKYSDLAEFAELIVRECIDVIYDGDEPNYAIMKNIQKHFGVQE